MLSYHSFSRSSVPAIFTAAVLLFCDLAGAQFIQRNIGGVRIDAHGVVASVDARATGTKMPGESRDGVLVPRAFRDSADRRVISLRALQDEVGRAAAEQRTLSVEVKYLGGLMAIEQIVVDPSSRDILLIGPAEAWTRDPTGEIVASESLLPVIHLDDLVTALRSAASSRQTGITCSIDPTPQGRDALQRYLSQVKRFDPRVVRGVEEALGSQVVTVTGVPQDSRFASVLAAADFQMKRYAMNLAPAPIDGLPGFLDLIRSRGSTPKDLMPRWWLAVDYEPPECSSDRLVWTMGRSNMRVLTENEVLSAQGTVEGTGKSHPAALAFSKNMTERFSALEQADPVFAQLHRLVDLAMLAAIVDHHDLINLAGGGFDLLMDPTGSWKTESWNAPRSLASQASFVRVRNQVVITASGGVEIQPWDKAAMAQVVDGLSADVPSSGDHSLASWCWQ
jgi:hypothetical protein